METRKAARALMATSAAAFAEVRREIEALAETRVLPVDVHVPCVAVAVRLAVPRIEDVLSASAEIPPSFDLAKIHRLRVYAAAAWHAYTLSFPVNRSLIEGLSGEATACRETFSMYAHAFVQQGWIRGPARVGSKPGMQALAHDVLDLAEMLSEAWPRIEGVGLQGWHLARASAIGLDLLIAWSVKSNDPPADAERTCARALSVLAYVYDDCRALIRQLRAADGDADDIAPPVGVPDDPDNDDSDEDQRREADAQDVQPRGVLPN
jgi:hypothetical protein